MNNNIVCVPTGLYLYDVHSRFRFFVVLFPFFFFVSLLFYYLLFSIIARRNQTRSSVVQCGYTTSSVRARAATAVAVAGWLLPVLGAYWHIYTTLTHRDARLTCSLLLVRSCSIFPLWCSHSLIVLLYDDWEHDGLYWLSLSTIPTHTHPLAESRWNAFTHIRTHTLTLSLTRSRPTCCFVQRQLSVFQLAFNHATRMSSIPIEKQFGARVSTSFVTIPLSLSSSSSSWWSSLSLLWCRYYFPH